jgi:hypothetical protein
LWLSLQGAALKGWHFVLPFILVRLICVIGLKIFFDATAMFFGLIAISVGLIAISVGLIGKFVGLIVILIGANVRFVSLFEHTKFKAAG